MAFKKSFSLQLIKKSFLPVIIFLALAAGYIYYKLKWQASFSPAFNKQIAKYTAVIFIISAAFIVQRLISGLFCWYTEKVAYVTSTSLDEELIPLLRKVSKIAIWVIALLVILPLLGININSLIVTLGVGSLAIALAVQDTFANIISGLMLMIDRPFRIGDKIKLPSGEVVKVLDIGARRSKFLAQDKSIIIVPNLELSKSKIVNYTYGEENSGS